MVGNGVSGIWQATIDSDVIQIYGAPPHSDGRWLTRIHLQPKQGAGDMGQTIDDTGARWHRHSDIRAFLPRRSAGRPILWHRDSWPSALGGCWGGFTKKCCSGSWVNNPGNRRTGPGSNPFWGKQCRRLGWRRWRPTSPGPRIEFHNILQRNLLWTSTWRWIGVWDWRLPRCGESKRERYLQDYRRRTRRTGMGTGNMKRRVGGMRRSKGDRGNERNQVEDDERRQKG